MICFEVYDTSNNLVFPTNTKLDRRIGIDNWCVKLD